MDALELLLSRTSARKLQEPGPSREELETIFNCALRAPDHGRLRPWRFVAIANEQRRHFGALMCDLMRSRNPAISVEALQRERDKVMRAPVIIVVGARINKNVKIPEVEQLLSAGAAAQNIMLAAHALGYGAMWKTGAPAYDDAVKRALGLEPTDAIVAFIYLGTYAKSAPLAQRACSGDFVSVWKA